MSSLGYSEDIAASLAGRVFSAGTWGRTRSTVRRTRTHSPLNHPATVSAPIAIDGATIGFVVAGVTSDPQRLPSPRDWPSG